jgi:hypothetical protein
VFGALIPVLLWRSMMTPHQEEEQEEIDVSGLSLEKAVLGLAVVGLAAAPLLVAPFHGGPCSTTSGSARSWPWDWCC